MKSHEKNGVMKPYSPGKGRNGSVTCTLLSVILAIIMGCAATTANTPMTETQTLPQSESKYEGRLWSEVGPTLDTPEKIVDYLRTTLRYKEEPKGVCNRTQSPEETLELRTGDCEDFAYIVVDALRNHGYETRFLTVEAATPRGTLIIHTLGVYRDEETNKWHYIQKDDWLGLKGGVSADGYTSIDAMAHSIAAGMNGTLYKEFIIESPEEYMRLYDEDKDLIN